MSSDTYRNELARLDKDAASLHIEVGRQAEAATRANAEAARKRQQAAGSRSTSSAQSYLRTAESEDRKVVAAEKKIGELRGKLASIAQKKARAENNLNSALKSERSAAEREDQQRKQKEKAEREARNREEDRRQRKEKAEQYARDREDARRRQVEKDHAREVSRLSSATIRHIVEREPEPEKLRVLYLTASPEISAPLRVDAEVNNVLKALRSAKHRDLIELFHRPAASPQDLVDGINDIRPHVVHFSGHGGSEGLLFDNASLELPQGKKFDFINMMRLLKATNSGPKLLVMNACYSLDGADILLEVVPVMIAMSDSVGDMSAGLFATHFYSAIGGAQSIGHAVEQAKAMVSLALPDEPDLVTLQTAEGVDAYAVALVVPERP